MVGLVLRYKLAVAASAIAGLVAGFVVGIPITPRYRARTTLEVLSQNDEFMNMKRNSPVSATDTSYDISEPETQTRLLQSAELLDRVIDKLDPRPDKQPPPKIATSGWRGWMHLREPVEVSQRRAMLQKVADSLKVKIAPHTRVMEATVDSSDPKLAAEFANNLAQEFIRQSLEARFAATHPNGDWLTREIDQARAALKNSEDQMQAYARSSGLIFTDDSNLASQKLEQLQQQVSAAISERIARQARFELATKSPPDSLADVLADPGLKELSAKINDLNRQIADLSAIYNPEFSKIRQAQAQLSVVQAAFERSRADIIARIRNDFDEALNREKLLASVYDAQTREVTGQDQKAIQYNMLKRDVETNRKLYDTMLQQAKESSIASALLASNVRVVDPAVEPDAPFFPNFRIDSILGLLAGLALSIGAIAVWEKADRTIQLPGDLRLWTDIVELGTIPAAGLALDRPYGYARPRMALSGSEARSGKLAPVDRVSAVELAVWQQKSSFAAEAYRSTLSSILFMDQNGRPPQVLVFTSAQALDGKTTTVCNLAIAMAEINSKVLIIDADLRRPRIQSIFKLSAESGLREVLSTELNDRSLDGLIHETLVPNLYVLPAGQPSHAASHLLYSRNFSTLLAGLRQEYDLILIDTPPMLAMTDARIAGRVADGVILVVRCGHTTRDSILTASNRLAEDSIPVLGAILNGWNPRKTPGAYHDYQSYSKYKNRPV